MDVLCERRAPHLARYVTNRLILGNRIQPDTNSAAAEPTQAATFPPTYTYPLYGDAEQVFGYRGLRLDLAFDCLSMKPLLTCTYAAKLADASPATAPIGAVLPEGDYVSDNETDWRDAVAAEAFTLPPEAIVRTYHTRAGDTCDVYGFRVGGEPSTDADALGKKLLRRVQVLALLYIEAGSYIDLADPGWSFYAVYKRAAKPVFVGFCTCYEYWRYVSAAAHDSAPPFPDASFRGRISQVVVLPPFQGVGHGRELYRTLAGADGVWTRDRRCVEITVEDPTEQFDELRDRCDLERALAEHAFRSVDRVPLDSVSRKRLREQLKLTPRQADRVLEMGLLWLLTHKEGTWIAGLEAGEPAVRRLVKRRVYLANREGLAALGDADVVRSKLQEVYERVARDHRKAAADVSRPLKRAAAAADEAG